MSPRGGEREGSGRPCKIPGEPREHFGCLLKKSNREWIASTKESTGKNAGEIIDLAIELLKEHPDRLR